MALSLTTEMLNAIEAGQVASALHFEFQTDEETFYVWNQEFEITHDIVHATNVKWVGLGDRIALTAPISKRSELQGQTVAIQFDASRINDNTDVLARIVDRSWHQRPVFIRQLLYAVGSDFLSPIGVLEDWRGTMDADAFSESEDQSTFILSAESGAYQFFRTNQFRRADQNQKALAGGDRFFDLTAVLVQQTIPFGTNDKNVPGR